VDIGGWGFIPILINISHGKHVNVGIDLTTKFGAIINREKLKFS
jgi:hypothetical protein